MGNLDIGFLLGMLLGAGLGVFVGLAMLSQRIRASGGALGNGGRFAGPMTGAGGPLPGMADGDERVMIASGVIRKQRAQAA